METIITVLITLGVVALIGAVRGVVRLSRRVDDLELIRMELIDTEDKFEKHLGALESSLDRRFDKVWAEVHTLDKIINPNKDLVK